MSEFQPMIRSHRGLLVERFTPAQKELWDQFVQMGKNATFLFYRDYMDYHSDRFMDYSLLVFRNHELLAVLPANLTAEKTLVSHQGLTFGGLIVNREATLCDVLEACRALLHFLHENQIQKLIYKRIPRFYSTMPDDELEYALFLLDARLCRRDCASVIAQQNRLSFRKGRKSEISKARRFGIRVVEEADYRPFWEQVLIPRLATRYRVKPVHSLEEITLLASRFPTNIHQFSAYRGDQIVAGATIYETPSVAHLQYSGVTTEGQEAGALDFLCAWLITERYQNKQYFDFGISNEHHGRTLNHGLLAWKEAFGGRTCAHDFYEVETANHCRLELVLPQHAAQ